MPTDKEEFRLDEYHRIILRALHELGGEVASGNQLFAHIKERYGFSRSKKTFSKKLNELVKYGYIERIEDSNPRLGITYRIKIESQLIEIFKNYVRLPPIEKLSPQQIIAAENMMHILIIIEVVMLLLSENKDEYMFLKKLLLAEIQEMFESFLSWFDNLFELNRTERLSTVEELVKYFKNLYKGLAKIIEDKKKREEFTQNMENINDLLLFHIKCKEANGIVRYVKVSEERGNVVFKPKCIQY